MKFPIDDDQWCETRDYLARHGGYDASLLAPNEFLDYFAGCYHYNVSAYLTYRHFEFVVVHKGMLDAIAPQVLVNVVTHYHAVFGNKVFVIYSRHWKPSSLWSASRHKMLVSEYVAQIQVSMPSAGGAAKLVEGNACVITTYNRPGCLRRSLPQILALGAPVVVVDDGSDDKHWTEVRSIASEAAIPVIRMPANRGLPNAINAGVGYWLADPSIAWISYFQDDVDVCPELFEQLRKVQHAEHLPLLTGRDSPEHRTYSTEPLNGVDVFYKRSIAGVHMHAHRSYWQSVMPVPTPYLGAPKNDPAHQGQGADEDWWISAWSPTSITKRGRFIAVVPGLVRTFNDPKYGSTWDNPMAELLADAPSDGSF